MDADPAIGRVDFPGARLVVGPQRGALFSVRRHAAAGFALDQQSLGRRHPDDCSGSAREKGKREVGSGGLDLFPNIA